MPRKSKLKLNKETLRHLDAVRLAAVAGAWRSVEVPPIPTENLTCGYGCGTLLPSCVLTACGPCESLDCKILF